MKTCSKNIEEAMLTNKGVNHDGTIHPSRDAHWTRPPQGRRSGACDHGTHEAIYLHDPDFNGIELAWDRDPSQWPRKDGAITFSRKPLDFASLLAELGEPDQAGYVAVLSAYK